MDPLDIGADSWVSLGVVWCRSISCPGLSDTSRVMMRSFLKALALASTQVRNSPSPQGPRLQSQSVDSRVCQVYTAGSQVRLRALLCPRTRRLAGKRSGCAVVVDRHGLSIVRVGSCRARQRCV